MQLNTIVYNNFVFDSRCLQKEATKSESPETPTSKAEGSVGDDTPQPAISLTPSVIWNVRKQMGGSNVDNTNVKGLFSLKYMHYKFFLEMAPNFMLFASCNLMQVFGFEEEINDALKVDGKSQEDVLKLCESVSMKICKPFTVSKEREFLQPEEQICYIVSRNLVAPNLFKNGINYCIVGSYDMESKEVICFPKYLISNRFCDMSFSLLNKDLTPYDFGCDLTKHAISFDINILKPF